MNDWFTIENIDKESVHKISYLNVMKILPILSKKYYRKIKVIFGTKLKIFIDFIQKIKWRGYELQNY